MGASVAVCVWFHGVAFKAAINSPVVNPGSKTVADRSSSLVHARLPFTESVGEPATGTLFFRATDSYARRSTTKRTVLCRS